MAKYQYQYGDKPLEGYTIQRAVGRGGFGEVYYATSDTGRQVALKAVQTYEQIELRGIQQCMNLKSPHLVSVFDAKYNADGKLFVIMEYVTGPSLADMIQSSPTGLGVQKTAFFLREIAKGLNYLHESGIVHRDLKPGNIFYENGQVKIGDYGLSKVINTSRYSNQTITVGTVHYMAPEIGVGKYDRSIDIYALGVMLYEMLTGQLPYVGGSPAEVLMKHMSATPDLTGLDETFARVIKKAMARDPHDRYSTVQEIVEDVFGAEQIQQSMSQFSPTELSVVAQKVAEKMQKQPASAPASEQPKKQAAAKKNNTTADKLYHEADKIQSFFYQESWEEVRQAAEKDPMKRKQRLLTALLTAGILSLGAGLFSSRGIEDAIMKALMVFAMIVAGAGGILLARYRLLCNMEAKTFRNLAVSAVAITFAGAAALLFDEVLGSGLGSHTQGTFLAMIPLIFISWWTMTDARRKDRVSLTPAICLGIPAFIIALIFNGVPVVSIALVAGICLYVQSICPFTGPDKKAATPVQPKAKPRPTTQSKAAVGVPAGASRYNRSIAAILCALLPIIPIAGLHRFYVGKIGTGIFFLLTYGWFGIGQLIDFIMILSGEFRDAQGRKVLAWDGNPKAAAQPPQRPVAAAEHGSNAAAAHVNNTVQPPPAAAGPAAPQAETAAAASPQPVTTVVIQDPTAKAGFVSGLFGFLGYVLIFISMLLLIGCAMNLVMVLPSCLPNEVISNIEQFWGTPNWPNALKNAVMAAAFGMFALAMAILLVTRRRFGGAHIIRFVIAVILLALAFVVVFASAQPFLIDSHFRGEPVGVLYEQILGSYEGAVLLGSLIAFIPAIILLAWPPKRLPPQIVSLNPETQKTQ